jgi:glycosyltransferase involved in cell wall biosynthesis
MKSRIWVFTLTYNESHFVKNFLASYKDAERIVVYDNESSDNTVDLLKQDKRVEVRKNDSKGEIRDDLYLEIKNNCWKEARGYADWVIIVDFDEIFTRAIEPDTFDLNLNDLGYFHEMVDIIIPYGYMIYDTNMPMFQDFNPLKKPLSGVYDVNSEKPCCFRPERIQEINFAPGCHSANPVCVNGLAPLNHCYPEFKLLHFKYVNIEVYFKRLDQYNKRMSQYNIDHGYGVHYTWPFEVHKENYIRGLRDSKPLFEIEHP